MSYKSPIEVIIGQMRMEHEKRLEGNVMTVIQEYGITADKDELIRALQYDRGQYDKGYEDGYDEGYYAGIAGISNAAPKMTNFDHIKRMTIEELAEFMCRHGDCGRCVGERFCRFGEGAGNGITKYLESEVITND